MGPFLEAGGSPQNREVQTVRPIKDDDEMQCRVCRVEDELGLFGIDDEREEDEEGVVRNKGISCGVKPSQREEPHTL